MVFKQTIYFILTLLLFASCSDNPKNPGHEFMPDMYRSPSYETHSENSFFEDNSTVRQPVEGTVPREFIPYQYPNSNEGYKAAGEELKNPIERTEKVIAEGEVLYQDFCSHCHGASGKGDGKIVEIGKFPPPPAFNSKLKDLEEGKMFHSITYGKNLMGPHASQLTPDERWKIIHFIQKKFQNK